jgi:hypothetical protein
MNVDLPTPRMHPTDLHLFPQRKLLFSEGINRNKIRLHRIRLVDKLHC